MRNGAGPILDLLADLLFPAACPACGRPARLGPTRFCRACTGSFRRISRPCCSRCGAPLSSALSDHACAACWKDAPAFDVVRAAGRYEGALLASIHRLKFGGDLVQVPALARLLARAMRRLPPPPGPAWRAFPSSHQIALDDRPPYDLLIPVPLHPRRLRERGFNQAHLLALALLRRGAFAFWTGLDRSALARRRETAPQTRLSRSERRANLRGAFAADPRRVRGCSVLLVDDVMTTGATLDAAARALKRAGARRVDGLVVARAVAAGDRAVEARARRPVRLRGRGPAVCSAPSGSGAGAAPARPRCSR